MPVRIAVVALSLLPIAAQGQGNVGGRSLFEQKNCSQCHAYEARSLGPSVRSMRGKLKGNPAASSAGILAAADHAADLKSLSPENIRAISEWLAATTFDEQATAANILPKGPASKREAAAKAKREADAKAQAAKDAAASAKQEADRKAQAKRDADAQAKRDAAAKLANAELAKREGDAKARKDTGALEAIKRETEERARRDAEAQAAAKRDADARTKREADALIAQKRETEERARLDAQTRATKEAEAQALAKKPEAPVKVESTAKADPAARFGKKKIAYRDGSDLPPCPAPTGAALGAVDEAGAKAVFDRVGCQQCHAYVKKVVGPPMKQIHKKYKGDWECVVFRLAKSKTHTEEGVTKELKGAEAKLVADYIATRAN